MEILSLVDRLENLITSSQPMPMTKRVLVREQEVLQIIDLMRAAVPEEIKQARRINQDREHLLTQAQAEASRIIAAAREEADRLINDEKMVQLALARGVEIEREAEEHARQLRDGADAYASETLRGLEEQLSSLQTQLDQTILSIHKGLETLSVRAEEGEEEELEETLVQREDELETGAAWKEEDVAWMAPRRALRDELPSQPTAFPRRPSAPLEQPASQEAPRLSERKTFQQGKR